MRILAALSLGMYRLYQHPQAPFVGLLFILAIFMTGIGNFVFRLAILPALAYVDVTGNLLNSPSIVDVVYGTAPAVPIEPTPGP